MKGKRYRCAECNRYFIVRVQTDAPLHCPYCGSTWIVEEPRKRRVVERKERALF